MPELIPAAVEYVGEALISAGAADVGANLIIYATEIATAIEVTAAVATLRQAQIAQQRAARDRYNNSQKDAYVMSRSTTQPRQVVMGRRRVSGPLFFFASSGTDNSNLYFTLALAGHEIDAVEQIYFNDEPLLLDGSGNCIGILRTEIFSIAASTETVTLQGIALAGSVTAKAIYGTTIVTLGVSTGVAGNFTTVTVTGAIAGQTGELDITYQPNPNPYNPTNSTGKSQSLTSLSSIPQNVTLAFTPVPGSIVVTQNDNSEPNNPDTACTFTISGVLLTITSGTIGLPVSIFYSSATSTSLAKITSHLGTWNQVADPDLVANFPAQWSSADRAASVAYLVVKLSYDRDAYSGGVPNVSAQIRGLKCYDPRANAIPNWVCSGAVPGTPGALPTGWSRTYDPGMTLAVVGSGTDPATGQTYVDVNLYGTATSTGNCTFSAQGVADIAAAAGQYWAGRAGVRLLSGVTIAGWAQVNLQLLSYNSGGAGTLEAYTAITDALATGNTDPFTVTAASLSTGAIAVGLRWLFQSHVGVNIDSNFRLMMPMLWQGTAPGGANDPRQWTQNTALQSVGYATHPLGGRLPWDQVDINWLIAEANICDTSANYTIGPNVWTRPIYRSDYTADTSTAPTQVLSDMCTAMGGEWLYADGKLRVKAGAWRSPVATLDESWLQGDQPVQIQSAQARDSMVNAINGTFYDQNQAYKQVTFPKQEPVTYIAADKAKLPLTVDYGAVSFVGQAMYLAASTLRAAQQGMTVTLKCNMRAWTLEAFDNIYVTLARFGWVAKAFEVRSAGWTLDGGVELVLRETDPTTWDMDAGFPAIDPAPNTRLPDPWLIAPVTGLTVASGIAYLLYQSDGTLIPRLYASWTPLTDARLAEEGGYVEIRYGRASQTIDQWQTVHATPGTVGGWLLAGVQDRMIYLVQARAVGALGTSDWCLPVTCQATGKSAYASDVSGLAAALIYGAVAVSWNASTDSDYAYTELRQGASWGAGVPLSGSAPTHITGTRYLWAWPALATYTIWAAHYDFSGNVSQNPHSVNIVVNSGITAGQGAVSAMLTNDSTSLPADSTGHVTSYAGAVTTMTVQLGSNDDTANWTYAQAPSTGVTSALSGTYGNVCTVSGLTDGTPTGYVDITASKTGYTSVTKRYSLSKSLSSQPSAYVLNPMAAMFARTATAAPTPATVAWRFNSDGTMSCERTTSGGAYVGAGSWYTPTTTGIGGSYYVRIHSTFGATLTSGALDTWQLISGAPAFVLTAAGGTSASFDGIVSISTAGTDDTVVATGALHIEAESS